MAKRNLGQAELTVEAENKNLKILKKVLKNAWQSINGYVKLNKLSPKDSSTKAHRSI